MLAVTVSVYIAESPSKVAAANNPSVLVNITSGKENLHSVSMGLDLAMASLERGRKVVIFLNVKAPIFASKKLGDDVKYSDFPPVKSIMSDLIAKGAMVAVCAHCAEVNNIDKAEMIDGIKIVQKGEILDALDSGTVSFTY
jgi:predicted peroxiredoxin